MCVWISLWQDWNFSMYVLYYYHLHSVCVKSCQKRANIKRKRTKRRKRTSEWMNKKNNNTDVWEWLTVFVYIIKVCIYSLSNALCFLFISSRFYTDIWLHTLKYRSFAHSFTYTRYMSWMHVSLCDHLTVCTYKLQMKNNYKKKENANKTSFNIVISSLEC